MGKSSSADLRVRIYGGIERGQSCRAAARLPAERGVKAHPASLSRLLIQHGLAVKKTLLASETDRADIVRARSVWRDHRQPWMKKRPERLVFIDETGRQRR